MLQADTPDEIEPLALQRRGRNRPAKALSDLLGELPDALLAAHPLELVDLREDHAARHVALGEPAKQQTDKAVRHSLLQMQEASAVASAASDGSIDDSKTQTRKNGKGAKVSTSDLPDVLEE